MTKTKPKLGLCSHISPSDEHLQMKFTYYEGPVSRLILPPFLYCLSIILIEKTTPLWGKNSCISVQSYFDWYSNVTWRSYDVTFLIWWRWTLPGRSHPHPSRHEGSLNGLMRIQMMLSIFFRLLSHLRALHDTLSVIKTPIYGIHFERTVLHPASSAPVVKSLLRCTVAVLVTCTITKPY